MDVRDSSPGIEGFVVVEAYRVEVLAPADTPDRVAEVMRVVMDEGFAVLGHHVTSRGVTMTLEAIPPGVAAQRAG